MENARRKEIAKAWKDRKVEAGIVALTCSLSGETWVGLSRNLASQQNSIWFGLKQGTHPNRMLQAAWKTHGEASFALRTLEVIADEDMTPYLREAELKARERHWCAELGAAKIVG